MPERVEVGRSKAKEVTVSSRRARGGRILLQVRFVCDGSNSSGRDNTRKMTRRQSGRRQPEVETAPDGFRPPTVSFLHRKSPSNLPDFPRNRRGRRR